MLFVKYTIQFLRLQSIYTINDLSFLSIYLSIYESLAMEEYSPLLSNFQFNLRRLPTSSVFQTTNGKKSKCTFILIITKLD